MQRCARGAGVRSAGFGPLGRLRGGLRLLLLLLCGADFSFGKAYVAQVALVAGAVADHEQYVHGRKGGEHDYRDDDGGAAERLRQAALHVLRAGELNGGARHEFAGAEDLPVQCERHFTEHGACGYRRNERFAVALGVYDNVSLYRGEVRVVGDYGGDRRRGAE